MLNIRTLILAIVLVVILMLSAQLVTAGTEVVSDPLRDPASVLDTQEESANQNSAPIPSYRSPLDECYDMPLREATRCREEGQTIQDNLNGRYERRVGLPR